MSLECDGRYVQNVVVVCVRHEDKVCSSDMRVNGGRVRRRNIIPTIEWPRVSRCSRIRGPAGRLRSKDSRNIWIDQDNCCPVADLPPLLPHPPHTPPPPPYPIPRLLPP